MCPVISYLAIFAAGLGGFVGLPPWTIAATAIALASISYFRHEVVYRRARATGFATLINSTVVRSAFNAVVASAAAYGSGYLIALI